MQWCHWEWQCHDMKQTSAPVASHDQKSNISPYLTVVTKGMLWCHCHHHECAVRLMAVALGDANIDTSGIT